MTKVRFIGEALAAVFVGGTIAVAVCSLALGCGAPADEGGGLFIGENQQALSSRFSATYTYGLNAVSGHIGCHGVGVEVCINLPVQKNFRWCDDTITHADTLNAFATATAGVQQASSGNFTFQYVGHCSSPFIQGSADVLMNELPCAGDLTVNIDGYACANWGQQPPQNTLSESLPGIYYAATTNSTGVVHIDRADILARGANATEDSKLLLHAAYKMAWETVGIGTHSEPTNAMTGRLVTPINQNRPTGTTEDKCRAASYSTGNATEYHGVAPTCPAAPIPPAVGG